MLVIALAVNLMVLVPVVTGIRNGSMDAAFGMDTDARRFLTCVYLAIAGVSAGLIALHVAHHPWAVPMTFALFAVQITYKMATVVVVGPGSPVVMTNVAVVLLQVGAIASWSIAWG